MIEIKVIRNVILNNINLDDKLLRIHRSPPRNHQNFPDSKIQWFDKSDTDILDLIIECFSQDKSCQKGYFQQLIFQWYTSYFALVSLREPPKLSNSQIWWFFRSCTILLDMTGQCFNQNKSCQKLRYEQLCNKLSKLHRSWQNSAILQSHSAIFNFRGS